MTLHYYMYRSWQDCCRRGENRSWPSVSVESVDSEYWCLNNAIIYAFIMRLTVEERVLRSTFKLNILYIKENSECTLTLVQSHKRYSKTGRHKENILLKLYGIVRLFS